MTENMRCVFFVSPFILLNLMSSNSIYIPVENEAFILLIAEKNSIWNKNIYNHIYSLKIILELFYRCMSILPAYMEVHSCTPGARGWQKRSSDSLVLDLPGVAINLF